jgi:hypothetical protein
MASTASAATIAYLGPQSGDTGWLLATGLVVLWAPLLGSFPLSTPRLAVTSGTWFSVGIPGAYFFGVFVACTGALLGLLLVLHAVVARALGQTSRSPTLCLR